MRNLIRLAFAAVLVIGVAGNTAMAYAPSIADLDAAARAVGNRRDLAQRIGESVFSTRWSAEVSQISANSFDGHLIVGIRILGVKFHQPLTQPQFESEVAALVQKTFAAEPSTEEIDLWASVPIEVAKGEVVSGDLAKPTSRTVFSLTARRGETSQTLRARIGSGDGVFWDPRWTRTAFKA